MKNNPIDLVVFDLGRVMIRLVGTWPKACAKVGVPYSPAMDDPVVRARLSQLFRLNEIGEMDHDAWTIEVAKLTDRSPEQISRILMGWLDGPFEGWDLLLDEIHGASLKTACLSNTNQLHWEMMLTGEAPNRLPLDRLHYRFASHLIRAHKPEPRIYEHVEIQTGIQPARILFFDDLEPNVVGARARGWKAHRINQDEEPAIQVRLVLRELGALE